MLQEIALPDIKSSEVWIKQSFLFLQEDSTEMGD